jgi:hypothetical protein
VLHLPGGVALNLLVRQSRPGDAAAPLFQPLAVVRSDLHRRVQTEPVFVGTQGLRVALNKFERSVMLVSHCRALLREVCNKFWLARRSVRRWYLFDFSVGTVLPPCFLDYRSPMDYGNRMVTVYSCGAL